MSYFTTVECPKCGKEKQLHLGGFGFYGVGMEHCSCCGTDFDPQPNCVSMVLDKDGPSNCDNNDVDAPERSIAELEEENQALREENNRLKGIIREIGGLIN